jgi:hypothetical protein
MRSLGVVTGVALLTAIYGARSAAYRPAAEAPAGPAFVAPAFQDAFTFAALLCVAAAGLALVRDRRR